MGDQVIRFRFTTSGDAELTGSLRAMNVALGKLDAIGAQSAGKLGMVANVLGALGPAGMAAAAGVGALVGVGVGLFKLADAAGTAAEDINNLVLRTGMAAEGMQELKEQAASASIPFEAVTRAAGFLNNALASAPEKFDEIGLSAERLKGQSTDKSLLDTVAAINKLGSASERTQAAMDFLGGRGGQALLQLKGQAAGTAKAMGLVMSDADRTRAAEFHDEVEKLERSWKGLWINLGLGVAKSPELQQAFADIAKGVADVSKAILDHGSDIAGFVSTAVTYFRELKEMLDSLAVTAEKIGILGQTGRQYKVPDRAPGPYTADKFTPEELARGRAADAEKLAAIDKMIAANNARMPGAVVQTVPGVAPVVAAPPGDKGTKRGASFETQVALAQATAKVRLAELELLPVRNMAISALEVEIEKIDEAAKMEVMSITAADKARGGKIAAIRKEAALQIELATSTEMLARTEEIRGGITQVALAQAEEILDPYQKQAEVLRITTDASLQTIAATAGLGSEMGKLKSDNVSALAAAQAHAQGLAHQREMMNLLGPSAETTSLKFKNLQEAVALLGGQSKLTDSELANEVTMLREMVDTGRATEAQIKQLAKATKEWRDSGAGIEKQLHDSSVEMADNNAQLRNMKDNKENIIAGLAIETGSVDQANKIYEEHKQRLEEATYAESALTKAMNKGVLAIAAISGAMSDFGIENQRVSETLGGASQAMEGMSEFAKATDPFSKAVAGLKIAGGAFKTIKGLLGGKEGWQKEAEEIGRDFGYRVSDELSKSIEQRSKDLKIGRFESSLLGIADIAEEAGKPLGDYTGKVVDLFNAIGMGAVPAKEGLESLDEAWAGLADEGALVNHPELIDRLFQGIRDGSITAAAGSEMLSESFDSFTEAAEKGVTGARHALLDLIKDAKAGGQELAGLKEYVTAAFSGAGADLTTIFRGGSTGKDAEGKDTYSGGLVSGSAAGGMFAANFEAIKGSQGLLAAISELGDAFGLLDADGKAALGPIAELMGLASEKAKPLLEAGGALERNLKALGSTGTMTMGAFEGGQQAALNYRAQLTGAGVSDTAALQAMGPMLGELQQSAADYGLTLSADLLKTIEEAKAAGVVFAEDPMQKLADAIINQEVPALQALTEALGGGMIRDSYGMSAGDVPMAKDGGEVMQTGLAIIHKGETIDAGGMGGLSLERIQAAVYAALVQAGMDVGGPPILVQSILNGQVIAEDTTRRQAQNVGGLGSQVADGLVQQGRI
jgi:hypothetical protein